MPTTDERTLATCREIAAELRAVAADAEADLTPEERRWLVEIAQAVERAVEKGRPNRPREVRAPPQEPL